MLCFGFLCFQRGAKVTNLLNIATKNYTKYAYQNSEVGNGALTESGMIFLSA